MLEVRILINLQAGLSRPHETRRLRKQNSARVSVWKPSRWSIPFSDPSAQPADRDRGFVRPELTFSLVLTTRTLMVRPKDCKPGFAPFVNRVVSLVLVRSRSAVIQPTGFTVISSGYCWPEMAICRIFVKQDRKPHFFTRLYSDWKLTCAH
jgi:hypothetical protein